MKDMNWWEKLVYTAIGWHYGCMQQPWILRMLLYPFGVLCIPFGAAFLPHYMCFPPGMPVPHFLQSNAKVEPRRGSDVGSDDLFGLRVVGHNAPLPHFFAAEAEAKELRMCHRDHSPACLEVVRITVKPNSPISPKNQHNTLQGNKTETEAPKEA